MRGSHRHDRPGQGAERRRRPPLQARVDRRDDVPALLGPAEHQVGERRHGELGRVAREVRVHGLLELGAAVDPRVEPGDPREQRAVRIATHVPEAAFAPVGSLSAITRAVGRDDLPALDLVLGDDLAAWRSPGRAAIRPGGEDLDVRHLQEQQAEQRDERDAQIAGSAGSRGRLPVHGPADTRINSARITKFATRLEPPYETNGSVMPVSGISRVTPPTITNVCTATIVVSPVASSLPNASVALDADAQAPSDQRQVEQQEPRGAEQAELLADRGEDEVGRGVRDQRRRAQARARCRRGRPIAMPNHPCASCPYPSS